MRKIKKFLFSTMAFVAGTAAMFMACFGLLDEDDSYTKRQNLGGNE